MGYVVSIELTAVGPNLHAAVGTTVKDLCPVCADKLKAFLNPSKRGDKAEIETGETLFSAAGIQPHFEHTSR